MKCILGLLILSALALTGCKDDVSFSQVENTGRETERPLSPDPGGGNDNKEKQGPIVKVVHPPSDHKVSKSTQVVFRVLKGDHEIDQVACLVDTQEIPCDWEEGVVKLKGYDLGVHLFEVVAVDVEGLVGKAKESWNIYNKFKRFKDNLKVEQGPKKTDILFVVDNSGSMKFEQTKISDRFNKFVEKISGLDWHLGITTTDLTPNKVWSDGRLDSFSNGDYYLTPALGENRAQRLFAENVKRPESGSNTEKGIKATYRSIQRALNPSSSVDEELRDFMRQDAALAVVVISDENESGNDMESQPDNLIELVESKLGTSKIFQFNSIIVHTKECLEGAGASMGVAYESLSRKTNGVVGDICANNYSELLQDIGQGVSDLQKVHKLGCEPQDINGDGSSDIEIKASGNGSVPGYAIDENTLIFDRPLNPGDYQFIYFCLVE